MLTSTVADPEGRIRYVTGRSSSACPPRKGEERQTEQERGSRWRPSNDTVPFSSFHS